MVYRSEDEPVCAVAHDAYSAVLIDQIEARLPINRGVNREYIAAEVLDEVLEARPRCARCGDRHGAVNARCEQVNLLDAVVRGDRVR